MFNFIEYASKGENQISVVFREIHQRHWLPQLRLIKHWLVKKKNNRIHSNKLSSNLQEHSSPTKMGILLF